MANNDDMREQLQSLETKFDRLEQKVDQLPTKADLAGFATKADLAGFATKADLTAFAEAMTDRMGIMLGDANDSVKKAAEGYGATVERIERDLNVSKVAANRPKDRNEERRVMRRARPSPNARAEERS